MKSSNEWIIIIIRRRRIRIKRRQSRTITRRTFCGSEFNEKPAVKTAVNISQRIKSKVGDCSQERPEGSFSVREGAILSLDYSTLPLIRTLYCWVLSKKVSSTIFKVFGITWPGIEPRSPGSLANTLLTRPMRKWLIIGGRIANIGYVLTEINP